MDRLNVKLAYFLVMLVIFWTQVRVCMHVCMYACKLHK